MPPPLGPKPFQTVGIEAQMNRRLAPLRHEDTRVAPKVLIDRMGRRVRAGLRLATRAFGSKGFPQVAPDIVAFRHRRLSKH
jgi:hypothetical protein